MFLPWKKPLELAVAVALCRKRPLEFQAKWTFDSPAEPHIRDSHGDIAFQNRSFINVELFIKNLS
jgi:hypothetical protein